MKRYTVRIIGEFLEGVEANNEKEAEQLAVRMVNIGLVGLPQFTISETIICDSPKKETNGSPDNN